jgi:hypothetical protein
MTFTIAMSLYPQPWRVEPHAIDGLTTIYAADDSVVAALVPCDLAPLFLAADDLRDEVGRLVATLEQAQSLSVVVMPKRIERVAQLRDLLHRANGEAGR